MFYSLPACLHREISTVWLGIGEYAALSWTCKQLCSTLKEGRKVFLKGLHQEIRRRLEKFAGFDDTFLRVMHEEGVVAAGSLVLALANRECWTPRDIDLWFSIGSSGEWLTYQLLKKRKALSFSSTSYTDWISEYKWSEVFRFPEEQACFQFTYVKLSTIQMNLLERRW